MSDTRRRRAPARRRPEGAPPILRSERSERARAKRGLLDVYSARNQPKQRPTTKLAKRSPTKGASPECRRVKATPTYIHTATTHFRSEPKTAKLAEGERSTYIRLLPNWPSFWHLSAIEGEPEVKAVTPKKEGVSPRIREAEGEAIPLVKGRTYMSTA